MFWPLWAVNNLPRWILTAATAALLGWHACVSDAYAGLNNPRRDGTVKFRLSGSVGAAGYSSEKPATNVRMSFDTVGIVGRQAELEIRYQSYQKRYRHPKFRFFAGVENYPFILRGRLLEYTAGSASLAWRPFGPFWVRPKHNATATELYVMIGPSLQLFPEIRGQSTRSTAFDLIQPKLVSVRGALRLRQGIHKNWRADLTGYWIEPLKLLGTSDSAVMNRESSRSFGADLFLEHRIGVHLDVGAGFIYQSSSLSYKRDSSSKNSQTIEWKYMAPVLFIQSWY